MSQSQPLSGDSAKHQQDVLPSSLRPQHISARRVVSPRDRAVLSRQNRRLQLRNTRLRATPLYSDVSIVARSPSPTLSDENNPRTPGRIAVCSVERSVSRLGILEELNNPSSTYSRSSSRQSTSSSLHTTFTVTDEGSPTRQTVTRAASQSDTMKIRAGSMTPRTPITKQSKSHHYGKCLSRSPSWEAAKYIEYLEGQLATVQTELRSLTSPSNTLSQSNKLRSLTVEARKLRQEVSEWEERFDERVNDDSQQRFEIEAGLRARIRGLERDLDVKETAMRELQWEVEHMEKKTRDSRVLEAENIALERRIDVLTELLALSPTKQQFELASPTQDLSEGRRSRRGRPTSMMSRVTSPAPEGLSHQLPAITTPRSLKRHSIQVGSTGTVRTQAERTSFPKFSSEEPEEKPTIVRNAIEAESTHTDSESAFSPISATSTNDPSHSSQSSHSTSPPSSSTSEASSVWDSPMPPAFDTTGRPSQKRLMRRFRSGSGGPKALILPATSGRGFQSTTGGERAPSKSPERSEETTPRARKSLSVLRPLSKPGIPISASVPHLRRAPRSAEPQGTENENWGWSARVVTPTILPDGDPVSRWNTETTHRDISHQSLQGAPRNLFAELTMATGKGNLSGSHQSTDQTSQDASTVVRDDDALAQCALVPSQEMWFGLTRERRPPSSTVTFGVLYATFRVLLSEVWSSPLKAMWRILTTTWLLNTSSRLAAGLGWFLLSLVLGSAKPTGRNRNRRLTIDTKQIEAQGDDDSLDDVPVSPKSGPSLSSNAKSETATSDPGSSRFGSPEVPPSKSHPLWMWLKFSVALVLAVGVAVKDGPQSLFMEDEDDASSADGDEDDVETVTQSPPKTDKQARSSVDDTNTTALTGWRASLGSRRFWPAYL